MLELRQYILPSLCWPSLATQGVKQSRSDYYAGPDPDHKADLILNSGSSVGSNEKKEGNKVVKQGVRKEATRWYVRPGEDMWSSGSWETFIIKH